MIKKQSVKAALHGPNREFAYGCDAIYTPINDEYGFKYFEDKKIRDLTYQAQKKAHEFGLAPAVGECYTMADKFGDRVYGYVTESVQKLWSDVYEGFDEDDLEWDDAPSEVVDLLAGLRELFGRQFFDLHSENCGWLKNGQLVCIDFSICNKDNINHV